MESGEFEHTALSVTEARREFAGCVKDRLASYNHWKTRDCLDQAILVARHQAVDLNQNKAWLRDHGHGG
jgi:hypothetical protein